MAPGGGGLLVLTHTYPFFDSGETERYVETALDRFPGDTALVAPAVGGRQVGEPYGGEAAYDHVFTDRNGYGTLRDGDTTTASRYDPVYLGGGDRAQCLPRTAAGLDDPVVVEELTYEFPNPFDTLFGDGKAGPVRDGVPLQDIL